MTEIPADVLEAAQNACAGFFNDFPRDIYVEEVARAILAERERCMNEFEGAAEGGIDAAIEAERNRCADIAESYSNSEHIARDMAAGTFPNKSRIQDAIAAKIRDSQS